jgi:hypothetical protein
MAADDQLAWELGARELRRRSRGRGEHGEVIGQRQEAGSAAAVGDGCWRGALLLLLLLRLSAGKVCCYFWRRPPARYAIAAAEASRPRDALVLLWPAAGEGGAVDRLEGAVAIDKGGVAVPCNLQLLH